LENVALEPWPTARTDDDAATVGDLLRSSPGGQLLLLDDQRRPRRWVTLQDIQSNGRPLAETGLPVEVILEPQATLHDALDEMLTSDGGVLPVVDRDGAFAGVVKLETIMAAVRSIRDEPVGAGR
jgi:osmoprotectant transport system ATP-binding protein